MTTWQTWHTARTAKPCDDYPRCNRGIRPGERYMRCAVTPNDMEVNQSPHWWTVRICVEHMRPEPLREGADA